MSKDGKESPVFILMLFAASAAGLLCGWGISTKFWRQDAVSRNVGEYNRQTGEWQWKAEYPKKDGKSSVASPESEK